MGEFVVTPWIKMDDVAESRVDYKIKLRNKKTKKQKWCWCHVCLHNDGLSTRNCDKRTERRAPETSAFFHCPQVFWWGSKFWFPCSPYSQYRKKWRWLGTWQRAASWSGLWNQSFRVQKPQPQRQSQVILNPWHGTTASCWSEDSYDQTDFKLLSEFEKMGGWGATE